MSDTFNSVMYLIPYSSARSMVWRFPYGSTRNPTWCPLPTSLRTEAERASCGYRVGVQHRHRSQHTDEGLNRHLADPPPVRTNRPELEHADGDGDDDRVQRS
jgi:hypothetical protein